MENYTQRLRQIYPSQAYIGPFQILTFICQYWSLLHILSPLIIIQLWNRYLGWKSFICPFRLTMSPSLSCSVSCKANLYGLHSWLLFCLASGWVQPIGEKSRNCSVKRRYSQCVSSPCPLSVGTKGGCIHLPLPKSAPARQHSPDSCLLQIPVPIFPLLPFRL